MIGYATHDTGVRQYSFTTPSNCAYIKQSVLKAAKEYALLYEGETIPPAAYKIPLSCAGQTSPIYLPEPLRRIGDYADTVASDGTVTRRVKKLVLTGQESWNKNSANRMYTSLGENSVIGTVPICTNFVGTNAETYADIGDGQITTSHTGGGVNRLACYFSSITDTQVFKNWLSDLYVAGTPVTVWYVLSSPQTESFTAPTISTVKGENVLTVGTALPPSQISITGNIKEV